MVNTISDRRSRLNPNSFFVFSPSYVFSLSGLLRESGINCLRSVYFLSTRFVAWYLSKLYAVMEMVMCFGVDCGDMNVMEKLAVNGCEEWWCWLVCGGLGVLLRMLILGWRGYWWVGRSSTLRLLLFGFEC
jgi:hypothetical protein